SWLFAANPSEEGRDRRWSLIAPRSGMIFAVTVALGTALECQPYSHVLSGGLADYLRDRRGFVLAGTGLAALGSIALYMLIGGVWRLMTLPTTPDRTPQLRAPSALTGFCQKAVGRLREWALK